MPGAEGKMKQFASWFTHGVPNGSHLRKAIYEARSATEILGNVERFFEPVVSVKTSAGGPSLPATVAGRASGVTLL